MSHNSRARRTAAAAGLGVALAAGMTGAAAAESAARTVDVRGQFFAQPDGSYRSTGDFLGTYTLLSEEQVSSTRVGGYTLKIIKGSDQLAGCLDLNHNRKCDRHGPRGTITMAFQRVATFSASGAVFIESSCTHPVTRVVNTGRFNQFTGGLIFMADQARDGRGGDVKSTYRGTITIKR